MKLNIFIFKNEYLECTGQPIFDDHDAETFGKGQERALLMKELEKVIGFENTTLYHLGSYDDETMNFDLLKEPLLLLRCSDVITRRKDRSKVFDKALEEKEALLKQEEGAPDASPESN